MALLMLAAALPGGCPAADTTQPPRLVLQITVDQLRGDLVRRFGAGLGTQGFARLYRKGAVFTDAHHRHANTETIVGHVTLATGADPAVHGMVANVWFDRKTGQIVYNVQDPDYPLLAANGIDRQTEIDPTQRAATTDGRSPRNILTSTIGDEIRLHFGPRAKVFAVSIKDRGAIAMAGHAGQAYWFSKASKRFVTSSYYRKNYPPWVAAWHSSGKVNSYSETAWTLYRDRNRYAFGDRDDQRWETDFPGWGRVFPHRYGPADGKYYSTLLTLGPAGDEITVDFSKALIVGEQLGRDEVPDYLAISLSSTDYVGHLFGPSSLEAEDNIIRLDHVLADLLDYIDDTVGLARTLIVLSADHGAPEAPGYLKTLGIEAGHFSFDEAELGLGFAHLRERFGLDRRLIKGFANPYVYLNHEVIAAAGLDFDAVEQAIVDELQELPGIAYAVSSRSLRRGAVPDTELTRAVLANFNRDRSGDIYVVFEPHWFVADFDGLQVASAHGSPWSYDTFVPLVFAGPGVRRLRVHRRVETVDVAVTLAALLGIKPPAGAAGLPLIEVFE